MERDPNSTRTVLLEVCAGAGAMGLLMSGAAFLADWWGIVDLNRANIRGVALIAASLVLIAAMARHRTSTASSDAE